MNKFIKSLALLPFFVGAVACGSTSSGGSTESCPAFTTRDGDGDDADECETDLNLNGVGDDDERRATPGKVIVRATPRSAAPAATSSRRATSAPRPAPRSSRRR